MQFLRSRAYRLLRSLERYTHTDMLYLAKSGLWLTTAQGVIALASFGIAIAFANLVPKESYGIYRYVIAVAGVIGAFSLSGIGTALTKSAAQGLDGALRSSFWASARWSLPSVALALGAAVYYLFRDNETLFWSFIIVAATSPFAQAFSLYGAYLEGKRDFKTLALYGTTSQVAVYAILAGVMLIDKNPVTLLATYFAAGALTTGLCYWRARVRHKPSDGHDGDSAEVLAYGKHLSVMNLLLVGAAQIDRILIFQFLGSAQLAAYVFATAIPEQAKNMLKNVGRLAFPKFASAPLADTRKTFFKKSLLFVLFITAGVIVYIAAAPLVFKIFFPQYPESIFLSQLFVLALIPIASTPITALIQAKGTHRDLYRLNILSSVAQIMIVFVGVYFYGLIGAVVSRIASRGVYFGVALAIARGLTEETSAAEGNATSPSRK